MARRDHQHRVAVGRGLRHQLRADDGIAAAAIVDDDRLPEEFRQARLEKTRDGIVRAARWVGDDQTNRL